MMGRVTRTAMLPLTLLLLASDLWAAPLTKYDQRQEGELNVHAHLENFVILLIPGGGGLLNIAAKIAPGKHHGNKHVKVGAESGSKHPNGHNSAVAPVGIKAPPYKVDIDADRHTPIVLEITGTRLPEEQHEVVIAESPTVTISKQQHVLNEVQKPKDVPETVEKPEKSEKPEKTENPEKSDSQSDVKPNEDGEKPQSESSEKPHDVPEPVKSEPAPLSDAVEKQPKKPVAVTPAVTTASVAAPAAAADEKEASKPSEAERPAEPAKPVPADASAAEPAGDLAPPPPPPPKQVAQEAKSRATRLELLRTGLVASPSAPCAPHEVREGRCGRALEPARVTNNFEDAALLRALRFGLAPAN